MRILAEIGTDKILQVATGDQDTVVMNGRWLIDSPSGQKVPLGAATTVDAPTRTALWASLAKSLSAFPKITYNPLQTAADVDLLDLSGTATINAVTMSPRLQTGRVAVPAGNAPNMTALLPANAGTNPTRPGMLLSKRVDITADAPAGGVDTFMVHWSAWSEATTHDVATDQPATVNSPAIKTLTRLDPNLGTLRVFLTNDDGAHWTQARFMEPVRLFAKGVLVRVCILNDDTTAKVHILGYAALWGVE